ncbi:MAG: MerR family transcriptional regulator [Armatimonadetes bacterium]|nr:MerR family transcriptional regulator [Armatimonadota bacterium]
MKADLRPIGAVLRTLGICRSTLWEWERRGIVAPYRDHRGHRYYDDAQVEALRQRLEPKQPEEAQVA